MIPNFVADKILNTSGVDIYLRKSSHPSGPEVEMVIYWPHNHARVPITFKKVNESVYAFVDGVESKEVEPSHLPSYFNMPPPTTGSFYSNNTYNYGQVTANVLNFSTAEDGFTQELADYLFDVFFEQKPPELPFFNRFQTALYLLRYPLLRTLHSKNVTIENLFSTNWFLMRYGNSLLPFKNLVKDVFGHDNPHLLKQVGNKLYKQVDVMKQSDNNYYTLSDSCQGTADSLLVSGTVSVGGTYGQVTSGAGGSLGGLTTGLVTDATTVQPLVFTDQMSLRRTMVDPSTYNVLYTSGVIFKKTILDLSAFDVGPITKDILPLDYLHQVMDSNKLVADSMHLSTPRAIIYGQDSHHPLTIDGTVIRGLHSVRDFLQRYDHKKIVKILTTANGYGDLRDTADQYETHPDKIVLLEDFKTLKDIHDYVSREFGKIKDPAVVFEYPDYVQSIDGVEIEGLIIKLAKDSHVLIDWGQEMHNCIGSYKDRVASKECVLIGVYEGSKIKYNIEVGPAGIKQFKKVNNVEETGDIRNKIAKEIMDRGINRATMVESAKGYTALNNALVGGNNLVVDNGHNFQGYVNTNLALNGNLHVNTAPFAIPQEQLIVLQDDGQGNLRNQHIILPPITQRPTDETHGEPV